MPEVKSVQFVSKAQGLQQMEKDHPEMTQGLVNNPIPAKFVIYPKDAQQIDTIVTQIAGLNDKSIESTCPAAPGTSAAKTTIGRECGHVTHRVVSVARYLWIFVLIAFAVLLISSTLLVANTIRLSIFARRREIEVMKLVGATNWFVRGPFMLEGLLQGFGGSVLAVILLVLGKEVALPAILGHTLHGGSDVHPLPFALNALSLLGAGLLLGAAGSGLTLRRFLQV